jgi:hypothetical protein
MYKYIGSTETLFDEGGIASGDNFLFQDLDDFEGHSVEPLTKDDFEKKVALPFKLGFLTESNCDINFSFEPKNDLVIAQDNYDGICYLFAVKEGT